MAYYGAMKSKRQKGISAKAWFYGQPGFHTAPVTLVDETKRPAVIHVSVRKDGRTDIVTHIGRQNRANLCGAPISEWDIAPKNAWMSDRLCPACLSLSSEDASK